MKKNPKSSIYYNSDNQKLSSINYNKSSKGYNSLSKCALGDSSKNYKNGKGVGEGYNKSGGIINGSAKKSAA